MITDIKKYNKGVRKANKLQKELDKLQQKEDSIGALRKWLELKQHLERNVYPYIRLYFKGNLT